MAMLLVKGVFSEGGGLYASPLPPYYIHSIARLSFIASSFIPIAYIFIDIFENIWAAPGAAFSLSKKCGAA